MKLHLQKMALKKQHWDDKISENCREILETHFQLINEMRILQY